eukprot:gene2640-5015_t
MPLKPAADPGPTSLRTPKGRQTSFPPAHASRWQQTQDGTKPTEDNNGSRPAHATGKHRGHDRGQHGGVGRHLATAPPNRPNDYTEAAWRDHGTQPPSTKRRKPRPTQSENGRPAEPTKYDRNQRAAHQDPRIRGEREATRPSTGTGAEGIQPRSATTKGQPRAGPAPGASQRASGAKPGGRIGPSSPTTPDRVGNPRTEPTRETPLTGNPPRNHRTKANPMKPGKPRATPGNAESPRQHHVSEGAHVTDTKESRAAGRQARQSTAVRQSDKSPPGNRTHGSAAAGGEPHRVAEDQQRIRPAGTAHNGPGRDKHSGKIEP